MTARQLRVLAGPAGALAAVTLALAGCAAVGHPAADTVPRPASQTAIGHASPQAAARAATAARRASPLLKCADPVAAGHAPGGARGVRSAVGPAAQVAAHGGSASPIPLATAGRVTVRQVGVAIRSQPGLLVLCGTDARCPPGFRAVYPRIRSGRRPPYVVVCIPGFPMGTSAPEPRLTPAPVVTRPLHTMPPNQV